LIGDLEHENGSTPFPGRDRHPGAEWLPFVRARDRYCAVELGVADAQSAADPRTVAGPREEFAVLRRYAGPGRLSHRRAHLAQLRGSRIDRSAARFDLPALESKAVRSDEVTDHYLADLAQAKGLTLATLDGAIAHAAVERLLP